MITNQEFDDGFDEGFKDGRLAEREQFLTKRVAERGEELERLRDALGLALTAMSFEADRAIREQDGVALTQLHEAIMAARTALKQ